MNLLLSIASGIDALNGMVGRLARWLILVAVLISAFNAFSRKMFDLSSNGMLEIQWYLFAAIFLLCGGYTLLNNEHVRVDVLLSRLSRRNQLIVEMFGIVLFLMPVSVLVLVLSWQPFMDAYISGEMSSNAGGLVRWPVKLLIPAGFALLILQAVSELIKTFDQLRRLPYQPSAPAANRQG